MSDNSRRPPPPFAGHLPRRSAEQLSATADTFPGTPVSTHPPASNRPPNERPPSGEHPTWPDQGSDTATGRLMSICADLNHHDADEVAAIAFCWVKCSLNQRVLLRALATALSKIDPSIA